MGKCKWLPCVTLLVTLSLWCRSSLVLANDSPTIHAKYFPEEAFSRIPEFFSGKEYTGDRLILRTDQPRKGLYFSIPLGKKNSHRRNAKSIELQLIESTHPQPRILSFPVTEISAEKKTLLLGVTGKDWNELTMKLVAWKVVMLTADGSPLFTSQSALWAHQK